MGKSHRIRSVDVPQADSLPLVRQVVEAVHAGHKMSAAISTETGFSERHVRYRLEAARILGLLVDGRSVTPRGKQLLGTARGSSEELEVLRECVRASNIISNLAPTLLADTKLDVAAVSGRIQAATDLAPATADRRAVVLRAWHRQLVEEMAEKKELP